MQDSGLVVFVWFGCLIILGTLFYFRGFLAGTEGRGGAGFVALLLITIMIAFFVWIATFNKGLERYIFTSGVVLILCAAVGARIGMGYFRKNNPDSP